MLKLGAIEQALALFRMPTLARALRQAALPTDVSLLVRLVGGVREAEQEAVLASRKSLETVREAARFYVSHVLLDRGSDSYRKLGATPEASREQLRLHMALLLLWLHPDLNKNGAHDALANRVMQAWEELKDPKRRALLDERLTRKVRGPGVTAVRPAPARPGRMKALHLARARHAPSATHLSRLQVKGGPRYRIRFLITSLAATLVLLGFARPDFVNNLRDWAQIGTIVLFRSPFQPSGVHSVDAAGATTKNRCRTISGEERAPASSGACFDDRF